MSEPQTKRGDGIAEAATLELEPAEAHTRLSAQIEALLLSSDRPLSEARLAELLDQAGPGPEKTIREAVEQLNDDYERTGRSFRAQRLAGGWQLLTLPIFGELLAKLHHDRAQARLSPAALETLAIIAYRQPILRAQIEAIRGVGCGEVLRGLLERRLVKIVGRAEELGRPMLYGTTTHFLKVFGIGALDDLPHVEGLREQSPAVAPVQPAESADGPAADRSEAGADQGDGETSS